MSYLVRVYLTLPSHIQLQQLRPRHLYLFARVGVLERGVDIVARELLILFQSFICRLFIQHFRRTVELVKRHQIFKRAGRRFILRLFKVFKSLVYRTLPVKVRKHFRKAHRVRGQYNAEIAYFLSAEFGNFPPHFVPYNFQFRRSAVKIHLVRVVQRLVYCPYKLINLFHFRGVQTVQRSAVHLRGKGIYLFCV